MRFFYFLSSSRAIFAKVISLKRGPILFVDEYLVAMNLCNVLHIVGLLLAFTSRLCLAHLLSFEIILIYNINPNIIMEYNS